MIIFDLFEDNNKKTPGATLVEFAPSDSSNGDDGFSEETLKQLAAQWYNGDEDPEVERTLMVAGWEIGQDEGYDDEPGVFVVQAGDVNGNSYISWPADELRQDVAEGQYEIHHLDPEGRRKAIYHHGRGYTDDVVRKDTQYHQKQNPRDTFQVFKDKQPFDWQGVEEGKKRKKKKASKSLGRYFFPGYGYYGGGESGEGGGDGGGGESVNRGVAEAIREKGALKAAQDAAKFIIRNLDDRNALRNYSANFWSPEKFYQGATMAMRPGISIDDIVKAIKQDRPAQFEGALTEMDRRGFLRGLAGLAASAAAPTPILKLLSTPVGISSLSTPAGVTTLGMTAGLALLKGIKAQLDQYRAEDDDAYFEAWEDMAAELGFDSTTADGEYIDPLGDLLNLYRKNPEQSAQQLIKHIQSKAVDPAKVKASFQPRDDWRYHARKNREEPELTGGYGDKPKVSAQPTVTNVATAPGAFTRAATMATAGMNKLSNLRNKTQPAPTVKDMGPIQRVKPAPALPAPTTEPELNLAPNLKQKVKTGVTESLEDYERYQYIVTLKSGKRIRFLCGEDCDVKTYIERKYNEPVVDIKDQGIVGEPPVELLPGEKNEGLKSTLGAAALATTMALGAGGAQGRVMPGDDPNINRLTGQPIATQQASAPVDQEVKAPVASKGFSKEYLQKAADPNRFGRYLISIEKAQELLNQLNEVSPEYIERYKKEHGRRATAADQAGDYAKGHEHFKKINKLTKQQFQRGTKPEKVDEISNFMTLAPKPVSPEEQWKRQIRLLAKQYQTNASSLAALARENGPDSAEAVAYEYLRNPSKIRVPGTAAPASAVNWDDVIRRLPMGLSGMALLQAAEEYLINNKGMLRSTVRSLLNNDENQRTLSAAYAKKKTPAESVTEESDNEAVEQAIVRRIMVGRTDLLLKYGPKKVMQAVEDVADYVGSVDEIGSSDVSGWVRQVEQVLGQ